MFVDRRRLPELPFAFEVQRQIVEEFLHGTVHRAAAELLERHVEHALALEGEPKHLVGLDAFRLDELFALLGEEEPSERDGGVVQSEERHGIEHLQPPALGHE